MFFPLYSTSIYKGFSMAMLNNQMVIKIGITGKLEIQESHPFTLNFPVDLAFPAMFDAFGSLDALAGKGVKWKRSATEAGAGCPNSSKLLLWENANGLG